MLHCIAEVALAGVLLAAGGETSDDPLTVASDRMTHFYLTPTREEFDAIQGAIKANLKVFKSNEKENGTATLATVFLARVNEKYHYPLIDIGNLDDGAKSIAAGAGSSLAKYVRDDSRIDPGKLDIWWISYFASGDTSYLDKILAQVADVKSQSDVANILVAGAANWSVASNCEQHPAILEHVRSVLAHTPPPKNAAALKEAIAKVGKNDD